MENLFINQPKVLIIEPFYGGSHKELIDTLTECLTKNKTFFTLTTLPAKKWHWRARCSALVLCDMIPQITTETILFCSSILNLAELLGLRPDLHSLKKIVYFHENQLIYPVQQIKSRDVQYAYNEITTSLAADRLIFNSNFNRSSFMDNINKILKMLPDNRPKRIKERIEEKSEVLYFPMKFPTDIPVEFSRKLQKPILHIIWPHRWEFDKGPEEFFNVMLKLKHDNYKFQLSVLGQMYTNVSEIFDRIKKELATEIINFGYVASKHEYFEILSSGHVVVSTAKHEFFGVSILESTYYGCLPLLPKNLVYPEIYPTECLYADLEDLYITLKTFCQEPEAAVKLRSKLNINFEKYSSINLLPKYLNLFEIYI